MIYEDFCTDVCTTEKFHRRRGFRHEIDSGCDGDGITDPGAGAGLRGISNKTLQQLRLYNLTVAQTYCSESNDGFTSKKKRLRGSACMTLCCLIG